MNFPKLGGFLQLKVPLKGFIRGYIGIVDNKMEATTQGLGV